MSLAAQPLLPVLPLLPLLPLQPPSLLPLAPACLDLVGHTFSYSEFSDAGTIFYV